MSLRILHYLNQFFGQKGGEEAAGCPPEIHIGPIGVGLQLEKLLAGEGNIIATIICGDSYFNENADLCKEYVRNVLNVHQPDMVVTGPAFNAGRYGMACGTVAQVAAEMGIPVISGIYPENPGYELYRPWMYAVETGNSAASMRTALPAMATLIKRFIATGGNPGLPEEAGYLPRGVRINHFESDVGAVRAVRMLMQKMKGEPFKTEYPMPAFDRVDPQPPVIDLSTATIALVTSGGVVPKGNPDHIESSSASRFGEYAIDDLAALSSGTHQTAHGGYDPVACNDDPNRVLPVDALRELEKEGKIGKLFSHYYSTVGNGTSVANARKYGADIAMKLQKAGVSAAILTST
ncbi:glycine/betaine/sarcosine/D-proline family reductase selenoprotein B [Escherichia fergusonii]|nr:glycine/betaine/sarcosine/D-proline family reductase selenoprotein B [Escherichia fergusonii]EHU9787798.1 glycine/betaine/sarcosine/D-proline family reductase selenoprotein B [Escherichia fergusonii]EJM2215179.1 glycine/betaine/sarcosine/D-proline family reductase selenoprotein B [Escherichia fergusonii]MBZ4097264.1 glycine/betaine/sarcosine/D-proline family reductase selenoprotein B [Escherichia fergusonii]MBZ4154296.1 glycine/betaine/sarcosine/D-proline family reductase selenoprotein B [Es